MLFRVAYFHRKEADKNAVFLIQHFICAVFVLVVLFEGIFCIFGFISKTVKVLPLMTFPTVHWILVLIMVLKIKTSCKMVKLPL